MFERRAYLLDVTDRCPNRHTMQELVDVLARFGYNEFFMLDAAAAREVPLETERTAAYCRMQGLDFSVVGADEMRALETNAANVVAPTFAARSLCGRIEEMRFAMERAEEVGRTRRATRFLVTDLSDGYAWHPLCVSFPAIILGGNLMTAGRSAAKADLEKHLCSVMDLPVGGLLQRLGTLYLRGGALRANASELFRILANDRGYSRHPNLTDAVLAEVSAVAEGCRHAAAAFASPTIYGSGAVWAEEIVFMANLVDAACHRRDDRRLKALREEHRRIWLLRNRPGGLEDSLAKLPRF